MCDLDLGEVTEVDDPRRGAPVGKSNIYLFTSQDALSVHVHVPVHFIILSHLKALNMSHLVSHLR